MSAARALLVTVAVLVTAACGPEPARRLGIETRVFVDRTEARVGDPVGVTIEIETPEGFAIESPASPPSNERFFTERVERLDPIAVPGGVRHRVLWTLRARSVGDHRLPELTVPLVWPDGRIQALSVGGIPLPVVSVRGELPERDVFFDIRAAPAVERTPVWIWIAAGTGVAALLLGMLLYRRARPSEPSEPDRPASLARDALGELETALTEIEPRPLAAELGAVLRRFAERRWGIPGEAWTPEELPERVDGAIARGLRALDAARFARLPARDRVLEAARDVRSYLSDVARRD